MPLLLYLMQANVALLLFGLVYYAGLRTLTFYGLNRAFLLLALLFAALCPLATAASLFQLTYSLAPTLPRTVANWHSVAVAWTPRATAAFNYEQALTMVYAVGVAVTLGRFLVQLLALYRIYRRSRPAVMAGVRFRKIAEPVSAFAFWQTIFLNPEQYPPTDLAVVLRHEQVHVRQWHTLDTLLAQLSVVLYWFNPGAWLLRRAIEENLEFTTDQHLLRSGLDGKLYQYSLLRASKRASANAFVNHFYFLTLKTRIAMMNKQQSSPLHLVKYALLAPLALGLSLTFAGPKAERPPVAATQTAAGLPDNAAYYINGKLATKAAADQLNPNDIASMNALRGESVGKVLGTTSATEAILITTKQHENDPDVVALNRRLNSLVVLGGKLLLIGDREVSAAEFERALTTQTKQVTSLNAKDAEQRFGARGKNGAVLIAAQR